MDHVERQVRQILGSAAIRRDPIRYRGTLEAAATKVIEDFVALAAKQGIKTGIAERDKKPYIALSDSYAVCLLTDGDGEIYLQLRGWGGQAQKAERVPLEYDCVDDTFVGAGIDTTIAPVPGEPLPRVSGTVVLANAAAKLLASADGSNR